MKKKLSIIIPVKDEEGNILLTLETIAEVFKPYNTEVVIVDDSSSDDTYHIVKNRYPYVKIYRKLHCQGKGWAIKTGYKFIRSDSEYIIFLDADLQIDPQDIVVFFNIMDINRADVVVGNKKHKYSNTNYSLIRKVISYCYYLIIRVLFNLPLRDTQCGFKLFKKGTLDLIMPRVLAKQFAFDLELLVAMRDNHIRVADAPVKVSRSTTSTVRLKHIINTFIDTVSVWWRSTKGWYQL